MAPAVRAIVSTLPGESTPPVECTPPVEEQGGEWNELKWSEFLAAELRVPVRATFTRSRKSPVSVRPLRVPRGTSSARPPHGSLEVRLHRLFAEATPEVRASVVSWVRSGRRAPRACARLDAFIAEILRRVPPTAAKRALVPRGEHHDLARIARDVCATDLVGEFRDTDSSGREGNVPHIGWGRRTPSRTRRSLRLGSFDTDGRIVRIHPVLDQEGVPEWFVRYVVFHELLHAVHPIERGADDRWIHHGPAFRRRERAYPDHRRAMVWERAHLTALIRSARTGTPLPHGDSNVTRRTGKDAAVVRVAENATTPKQRTGVLRALQQLLFPDR